MKKITLKQKILQYFKSNSGWVHKETVCDMAHSWKYMSDTVSRTLRSLAEDGDLLSEERKDVKGVFYKLNDGMYKSIVYTIPGLGKTINRYERK